MSGLGWRVGELIGLAVLLGGAAWILGVPLIQSVVVGGIVAAVGAARAIVIEHQPTAQRIKREPSDVAPTGVRNEVRALARSLEGGRVPVAESVRLREVARRRLARLGVDLDAPGGSAAAIHLLGPEARLLPAAEAQRGIRFRAFVRCLGALERAEPERPGIRPPDHRGA